MTVSDARRLHRPDRRRAPRGGRRQDDRPGRDPLLLVADSYDEVRRVCVRYLDLFGFLVKEAQNADQALDVLRARPRVLLTDPQILLRATASLWAHPQPDPRRVPVILLVADLQESEAVLRGLRPAAVLHKPFHMAALMNTLRRVLRSERSVIYEP